MAGLTKVSQVVYADYLIDQLSELREESGLTGERLLTERAAGFLLYDVCGILAGLGVTDPYRRILGQENCDLLNNFIDTPIALQITEAGYKAAQI